MPFRYIGTGGTDLGDVAQPVLFQYLRELTLLDGLLGDGAFDAVEAGGDGLSGGLLVVAAVPPQCLEDL